MKLNAVNAIKSSRKRAGCCTGARSAKEGARPFPGDVMVFRYGRCYSHGGIVTSANPLTIIHAFQPARAVIEDEVVSNTALCNPGRLPKFFSYWAMG
jgi:hypothetical protein